MAQPVSKPITSTPSVPGQPYNPSDMHSTPPWSKIPGGAADIHTGRLVDDSGDNWPEHGPWKQT